MSLILSWRHGWETRYSSLAGIIDSWSAGHYARRTIFTWDNCQFGEKYQHRQVLITNCPFLAVLARDCPNTPLVRVHEHLGIGFGKDLSTQDVSQYAAQWCSEYSGALHDFVAAPAEDLCVHCLPQGNPATV